MMNIKILSEIKLNNCKNDKKNKNDKKIDNKKK
jgi:hypothetical protein